MPVGDASLAAHFKQAAKAKGLTEDEFIKTPTPPPGFDFVYRTFRDLSACRGSSGFGPNRIKHSDIFAWSRLMGVELLPLEVQLILKLDEKWIAAWNNRSGSC